MSDLFGVPVIYGINPYAVETVPSHQLGAKGVDANGDIYRYAQAGATLASGNLAVAPAPKTNHHNVAVASAAAVGARSVTVTLGNTAAVADEYAEGYIVFSDVAPEGVAYRIKSHPAADAAASLTLQLFRPLVEALTTSSEACLIHNAWNGSVEAAVEERQPAGVPQVDIASASYGWLKTRGVSAALAGASFDLGANLTSHASTAGAVNAVSDTAATEVDQIRCGVAIVAGADTEYRPILLTID